MFLCAIDCPAYADNIITDFDNSDKTSHKTELKHFFHAILARHGGVYTKVRGLQIASNYTRGQDGQSIFGHLKNNFKPIAI